MMNNKGIIQKVWRMKNSLSGLRGITQHYVKPRVNQPLYSSMTDASVLSFTKFDTIVDDTDPRTFGYQVSVPVYSSRSYVSAMTGTSFYEDDYTVMMAARRPVEMGRALPNMGASTPQPCLNAALNDSYMICEIMASQAEWDEVMANDYTRPHFELLKEDPYVEAIEEADEVLQDLHDHDIVKPADP
jgi:hypothetical protein